MRRTLAVLLFLGSCLRGGAADAACTIGTVTGVAFGTYDVFAPSDVTSTGSLSYTCTSVPGTITIGLSTGNATSFTPRLLLSGTNSLAYNLYLDASTSIIWGDGTGGTSLYGPLTPTASATTVTIYGRIPALQNASVGTYADTITATITF